MLRGKYFLPLFVAAACAFLLFGVFYPGVMTPDSFSQFFMAKSGDYGDIFPPIMSFVWGGLNMIFPEPSGMLALNISLLMGGVLLYYFTYRDCKLSFLIFFIPFLPWIINFSGVLWKDVSLAFSLFFLSGILFSKPAKWKFVLAFFLFFYALSVRHNAVFAIVPIVFILLFKYFPGLKIKKNILFSFFIVFFMFFCNNLLVYNVFHTQKQHPVDLIMEDDLVHFSIIENKTLLPSFPLAKIQECAANRIWDSYFVGKFTCLAPEEGYNITTRLEKDNIQHVWFNTVIKNKIEYIRFRMAVFSFMLRGPREAPYYVYQDGMSSNSYGKNVFNFSSPNAKLTKFVKIYVEGSAHKFPFLFKPYWWLIISILLLSFTILLNDTATIFCIRCLLISSICYILGYALITTTADFRFVYWSVLSDTLCFLLLIMDNNFSFKGKRNYVYLSVFLCLVVGGIANISQLTRVNVSEDVYKHIIGRRMDISQFMKMNDFIKLAKNYKAGDNDPYLSYDVSSLQIAAKDVKWFGIRLYCPYMKKNLFSDLYIVTDKSTTLLNLHQSAFELVGGENLISFKSYSKEHGNEIIKNIKLNMLNSHACKYLNFSNTELINN